MTGERRCVLPASLRCLPQATAFVEAYCREHGVLGDDALRLTLIAEELFTNTATHGLHGSGDGEVRLTLNAGPAQVTLAYEDSAPAFDPLAHLNEALAELEAPVDRRRAGGFGLVLVAKMADRVSYARIGAWNRLTLTLLRRG
jgi:anti-sigma regulatory factor (Ser/Thr protein kinase)